MTGLSPMPNEVGTDPFEATPEDQAAAIAWLGECCDVGCGPKPLPGAQFLYDIRDWDNLEITHIDFYNPPKRGWIWPKSVYCRHVLEDMRYPEALLEEFKSCERGWIETPHPSVEMLRGVDKRAPWRGFSHHYWFVWEEDGVLVFLPKTPIVEHITSSGDGSIRRWNTYYRWKNYEFKYKILQHGIDFDFRDSTYLELLKRGHYA